MIEKRGFFITDILAQSYYLLSGLTKAFKISIIKGFSLKLEKSKIKKIMPILNSKTNKVRQKYNLAELKKTNI